jgi:hypothetical protein
MRQRNSIRSQDSIPQPIFDLRPIEKSDIKFRKKSGNTQGFFSREVVRTITPARRLLRFGKMYRFLKMLLPSKLFLAKLRSVPVEVRGSPSK